MTSRFLFGSLSTAGDRSKVRSSLTSPFLPCSEKYWLFWGGALPLLGGGGCAIWGGALRRPPMDLASLFAAARTLAWTEYRLGAVACAVLTRRLWNLLRQVGGVGSPKSALAAVVVVHDSYSTGRTQPTTDCGVSRGVCSNFAKASVT